MAASQTKIESQVIKFSKDSFKGFCDDLSGMFSMDMTCEEKEVNTVTVKDLKGHFNKLTAVYSVKTDGIMDGTFHLIFDQGGLFTLSGVIVASPESEIREQIKAGQIKDIEAMNNAIAESGNLLVGTWDRVFQEGLKGHGHFVQSNSFIGKPWTDPEKSISLAADGEFVFASYKMTIGDYPTFECGVVFPKTMFGPKSDTEQADTVEEKTEEEPETEQADAAEEETEEKPAAGEETAVTDETEESKEPAAGPVSEAIQKMTKLPVIFPGDTADVFFEICAKDIMDKNVVWGSSDDNVQQAIEKTQQADTGYMMVGSDGALEGIVSKSDLAEAVSIYLRPVFKEYRRPLDDATLQIKIKWIMSRPVHTVTPDTSLAAIMKNMSQFGQRALPVIDQQGKFQGLITVFDIFQILLTGSDTNVSSIGKTPQAPPLT